MRSISTALGARLAVSAALAALLSGTMLAATAAGQADADPPQIEPLPPPGWLFVAANPDGGGAPLERLPAIVPLAEVAPLDSMYFEVEQPDRPSWHLPSAQTVRRWFQRSDAVPSWRSRPISTSYALGTIDGDHLVQGRLDLQTGFVFNKRYGWDFAEHWGIEARLGEANIPLSDLTGQMPTHMSDLLLADFDVVVYPWGDTRWRPYLTVGTGVVNVDYADVDGHHDKLLLGLPAGGGCKYYWNPGMAFRVDVIDNVAFGSHGLNTTNNASLTMGLELRLESLRKLLHWREKPAP